MSKLEIIRKDGSEPEPLRLKDLEPGECFVFAEKSARSTRPYMPCIISDEETYVYLNVGHTGAIADYHKLLEVHRIKATLTWELET